MKCIINTFVLICFSASCFSGPGRHIQRLSSYSVDSVKSIEPGDQCPDLMIPAEANSTNQDITLSDFRGKLLLLDFWATWCGPCTKKLPYLAHLQEKFSDELQILMVSRESKSTILEFNQKYEEYQGLALNLLNVYDKGTLHSLFPHIYIPHYVWVSEEGEVIAITDSEQVTEENIRNVLLNKKVLFTNKQDRSRSKTADNPLFYNERLIKPIFTHKGYYGSDSMHYKSVLTGYIDPNLTTTDGYFTGRFLLVNTHPGALFTTAYSFSFSDKMEPFYPNRLILELDKPSELFPPPEFYAAKAYDKVTAWYQENAVVYDQVLFDLYNGPTASKDTEYIRRWSCEILKNDLSIHYPHIKAFVEKRSVDCLVLKCRDPQKVYSKEDFGKSREIAGRMGVIISNQKIDYLVRGLKFWLQKMPPIVDETNYTGLINLRIDGKLSALDSINNELKKFGLELVEEKRFVKMLILADN